MPRCPICHEPVRPRAENAAFPFCTERCRVIDLGNWLGERYRVPGSAAGARDEDPEATGAGRPGGGPAGRDEAS